MNLREGSISLGNANPEGLSATIGGVRIGVATVRGVGGTVVGESVAVARAGSPSPTVVVHRAIEATTRAAMTACRPSMPAVIDILSPR
jgi:hypothetical protein